MSDATSPISWRLPDAYARARRTQFVGAELLPLLRGSLIGIVVAGGVFLLASPLLPERFLTRVSPGLIGLFLIFPAVGALGYWQWKSSLITLDDVGIRLQDRRIKWQDILSWRAMPVPASAGFQTVQLHVRKARKPLLLPLPDDGKDDAVLRTMQARLGPATDEYTRPDPDPYPSDRSLLVLGLISLAYVAVLAVSLSYQPWVARQHLGTFPLVCFFLTSIIVGPGTLWALLMLFTGRSRAAGILSLAFLPNLVSNMLSLVLAIILQLRQALP